MTNWIPHNEQGTFGYTLFICGIITKISFSSLVILPFLSVWTKR